MLKRCLASHTDEWLGLAPGMRAHSGAPARHGNYDLKGFSQRIPPMKDFTVILPNEKGHGSSPCPCRVNSVSVQAFPFALRSGPHKL